VIRSKSNRVPVTGWHTAGVGSGSFGCAELQPSEHDTVKEARADALFSHDSDIKEFCSRISGKVFFLT